MLPIARWTFRRRLRHPRLSAFACGRTRGRRQGGTALAVTRRYRRPRSRTWALPSVSRAGGRSSPACRRTFSRKCWQKPLADGWPDHRRACRKAEAGVASGASAGAGGGRFIEGLGNEMSADDTRTRFSVRISYSDDSDGVTELLQASYSSLFGPAYSTDVLCQALASDHPCKPPAVGIRRILRRGSRPRADRRMRWLVVRLSRHRECGRHRPVPPLCHPPRLAATWRRPRPPVGNGEPSRRSRNPDAGVPIQPCRGGVLSLPGIFGNQPEHVAPDVRRRHSERTHAEVHCVMSACPHSAEGPQ